MVKKLEAKPQPTPISKNQKLSDPPQFLCRKNQHNRKKKKKLKGKK